LDTAAFIGACVGIGMAAVFLYLIFKAAGAFVVPSANVPKFVPPQDQDVVNLAQKELDAADTPEAMKRLIKEWKLARKELRQERASLAKEMRAIRATHTERVREQMPMFRGGGGVGKFIRGVQTAGRHAQRLQLAQDLAPHEHSLQALDHSITQLDRCILAGERRLLTFDAKS
jgi:hypothetical protein